MFTTRPQLIAVFMLFISLLLFSCKEGDTTLPTETAPLAITGEVTHFTDCKSNAKRNDSTTAATVANSETCVRFSYDITTQTLDIQHINSSFNCCTNGIFVKIESPDDTIFITENENEADCKCLCLYDIEVRLTEVLAQKYHIRIREPYASKDSKLSFDIDLASQKEGKYCVKREKYPWEV